MCESIIGEDTVRTVKITVDLHRLEKAAVQQNSHRFGDNADGNGSLFPVKTPLIAVVQENPAIEITISIGVISTKLSVLTGALTHRRMKSNIAFGKLNFGLVIGKIMHEIPTARMRSLCGADIETKIFVPPNTMQASLLPLQHRRPFIMVYYDQ